MAELKLELNSDGIQEFLKYDTQDMLVEAAETVAKRFKGDSTVDVHVGKTRANASVTVDMKDTFNNELLKAMQ